jgi:hypothetical protein
VIRPLDGPALARQIGVAVLRTTTAGSADQLLAELRTEAGRIRTDFRGGGNRLITGAC